MVTFMVSPPNAFNRLEYFRVRNVHTTARDKGKKVIEGSTEQRFITVPFT